MADQNGGRDLSKYQGDLSRIIKSLVAKGLPITLIVVILSIIAGHADSKSSAVRVNIPKNYTSTTTIVDPNTNLHTSRDVSYMETQSAIFSDGTTFGGNYYSNGETSVTIDGVPKYGAVAQIDDNRAITMGYSQDKDEWSFWMFTKGPFPEYSIEKLTTVVGLNTQNGRYDFIEQDGQRNLLFIGSYRNGNELKSGLLKLNVDTGTVEELIADNSIRNFSVNSGGDLYYIAMPTGSTASTMVYGTIENGKFIERYKQNITEENFPYNVQPHGMEVAENGELTLIHVTPNLNRNPTIEDYKIFSYGRDLKQIDKGSLAKLDTGNGEPGDVTPFMTPA